jgi:putative ABC transport system ATP-binding protein
MGDEDIHALADINLTIKQGEYLSIMGPSGSGKSTLLNIIGLLDRPDSGTYWLNDVDTTSLSADSAAQLRGRKIGFVFQAFHLIPRLTAAGNIELPMMLAGIDRHERQERLASVLEALDLTDRSDHRPDQLSGGQRQRVAIARATVMEPEVLLADEPTGNLDTASGNEVIKILENMNARGLTLIVVTHDRELGARPPRRIRMLDGAISKDTTDAAD